MKTRYFAPLILIVASSPVVAEIENDVPLGIEAVTGFRSEYIQRGFKWANQALDVQAEAEISLNDQVLVNLGGWFVTSTGSDDFTETSAFAAIRWEAERYTLRFDATWQSLDHPRFDSGLDLSPTLAWHLNDTLDLETGIAWNTGADGLYAFTGFEWSKALDLKSFVSAKTGLNWVNDYYDRSGLNDAYAKFSYTRVLNRSVSITPFAGTSLPLQSDGESARLFAGVWFEVNF
jgi:hypothetical protein